MAIPLPQTLLTRETAEQIKMLCRLLLYRPQKEGAELFEKDFRSEHDEELLKIVPEFDTTALSSASQRRVQRVEDGELANAMIRATKIINQQKVTLVAMLCQAQVDEAVTTMVQRNPHGHAARNLLILSQANAERLAQIVEDDYNGYWR